MPSQIERDIRLRLRVLKRHAACEREALRDIARRGSTVTEPRADSHGVTHDKRVPNPSIRLAREAHSHANQIRKQIARLQAELAAQQTKAKEADRFAFLDLPAKAERKDA